MISVGSLISVDIGENIGRYWEKSLNSGHFYSLISGSHGPNTVLTVVQASHTSVEHVAKNVIIILCELVPSTSDQLVDHQQNPLTVISGL